MSVADDRYWHICDIARSQMDVRFRGKSGRAADITGTTEFDPISDMDGSGFLQCTFAALPPHFARHPFLF